MLWNQWDLLFFRRWLARPKAGAGLREGNSHRPHLFFLRHFNFAQALRRLRGPDLGEEFLHLGLERFRMLVQIIGGIGDFASRRSSFSRGRGDTGDIGIDLLSSRRRLLGIAGDLLCRRALLLDRGRDRGGNFI